MDGVCSYLIKQALGTPLSFAMEEPFKDRTPNEWTPEKQQTLQNLYQALIPGRKMVVNARQKGRGYR
jgi:hypothetical protein